MTGGSGTATVNFKHTDSNYAFTDDGTTSGNAVTLTGSLSVNHTGSGTTTLLGTNTYTGDTTVTAGTLLIDGSIASDTTVGTNGTLGGSGTITGAAVIDGAISPGNSPGTLTFNGNLTLNATANTVTELNSAILFDKIAVSGDLIYGGTLSVFIAGLFSPNVGDQFQIFS